MLFYLIGRAVFYLIFGVAAVYMIERMRQQPLSFEMRLLLVLTGPLGFFISLIVFIFHKAFK